MKKRLTALLTACLTLLAALPMDAAAVVTDPVTEIKAMAVLPEIIIDVTVPSKITPTINPTGTQVTLDGKPEDGQILTVTSYIENQSAVPVSVSATVTGKINDGSDMILNSKSTSRLKTKAAFVYFELVPTTTDDDDAVEWAGSYNKKQHILVSDGVSNTKENFVTIGAASQDNHFGAFRLTGDCVASPKTSEWTEADGFSATIVFTFKAKRLTT
jgi:hypothetical protein